MKKQKLAALCVALLLALTACGTTSTGTGSTGKTEEDTVAIRLSDEQIQVDGMPVSTDKTAAVYTANDIVYYEAGKDFTYGEGGEDEAHSEDAAAAHTVVHITKPGTYQLFGKLSRGQIAVDLGEGAEDDPTAVVTLLLAGVDITCEVAPAVIFYRVYECASKDAESAAKDVDTAAAGANVVIADGTENTVRGSYVARIYKPDSVVLNSDGTAVEEAKKLHKYDGAFYSRMSMNVNGGEEDSGVLHIRAENEGMDSELHLTINGGTINIHSGNDGINTNEDGVSVTTVNGGNISIVVTGETGEGDGIDSNGWLVINGGRVIAAACSDSADAGIDSDMGIHINGGTVVASGHMLDRIEEGGQPYAVFNFAQKQSGGDVLYLKRESGETVAELCPQNDYSVLICSSSALNEGSYTLWCGDVQMAGQNGGMGGGSMMRPDGAMMPDGPENRQPPTGGQMPFDGANPPDGAFGPGGGQRPEKAEGDRKPGGLFMPDGAMGGMGERTAEFKIIEGGNLFAGVAPLQ